MDFIVKLTIVPDYSTHILTVVYKHKRAGHCLSVLVCAGGTKDGTCDRPTGIWL